MTPSSRARFAETVRKAPVDLVEACLLLAAEADDSGVEPDVEAGRRALAELAEQCAVEGPPPGTPEQDAEWLRLALAERAGFQGFPEDFADLRASLLPDVLERRRGLPILLSIVYVDVARRVGIDAFIIALPGRVVVGIGGAGTGEAGSGAADEPVMLDPYDDGRRLQRGDAEALVRGMGMVFDPTQLVSADPTDILARVLTNIRALASRLQRPRTQLWAVELSMLLPHHPVQLRRERAALRSRLGDFQGAGEDLDAYGELLDPVDEEAAEQVRREARLMRSRLN